MFHHLLWPHLQSVRACSWHVLFTQSLETANLYLSPRMAALLGSSLPPFQPSTVLDSVPAHGRALLHRLPLTRCQSLVRWYVVPARLGCYVMRQQCLPSPFVVKATSFPFWHSARVLLYIYSARQLPVVQSCLSLVCIENVRQHTIYSQVKCHWLLLVLLLGCMIAR